MTGLLENAMEKVEKLPEDEQNAIASQLLDTLKNEEALRRKLARNPARLRSLADEALNEHRRGETLPLDDIL